MAIKFTSNSSVLFSPFQGYTLPPTAAYFPMAAYSTAPMLGGPQQSKLLEGAQMEPEAGMTQPNTPDLLMHRRQARTKKGLIACV